MKRLWQYLKPHARDSVLAPLFKLFEAGLDLIVPLVMAAIIDTGIRNADTRYILILCAVLIGIAAVGLLCSITAQYFAARASVGFAAKLRSALFSHIQSLSYPQLDRLGASTLITRITSDVNQVQSGLNLALRLFLRSPFIVFGAMIMAFTLDARSAAIFCVMIPVLSAIVFGIMLWTMPLYRRIQQKIDAVMGITRENLSGARVIRAFNMEEGETHRFSDENAALTRLQLYTGRISSVLNPATFIVVNLALVALLWTGAIRVDGGNLTQGQLVALVNYNSQVLVELIKLANLIVNVTKALACAKRVSSVLDEQPEQDGGSVTADFRSAVPVSFRSVAMRYAGGGADALTGISFDAPAGSLIGVIGGTGAGKSTLANLIPGLYRPTEGAVWINGADACAYTASSIRSRVHVVPQRAVLFSGTVRENLLWGNPGATDEQLMRALSMAQAEDFILKKEGGLDAKCEQGGANFSGGQRQRLSVARALVGSPSVLILDDSASALDYATESRLMRAIREADDRPTTFVISQRVGSVRRADWIVVLDDGALAGFGTHEELIASCPVYREICASQEGGDSE